MKPPEEINVLDRHNGFTAITTKHNDTLWRPGKVLRGKSAIGKLEFYSETSFFQLNNDVTRAVYKVKGYPYKICLWFDNKTGERIA